MIISSSPGRLLVTTQPDHAFFSAEILALWRADGLPDHPRRAEILFAVKEHDNGWREPDAAPRIAEGGRPLSFFEAPRALRNEIWLRGIDRFSAEHPWASLLILEHAYQLQREHRNEDGWADFFQALAQRRKRLLEAGGEQLGRPPEELARELAEEYRFLELADLVSLAACSRWTGETERGGYRFEVLGDRVRLAPFPLAGATRFRVRCREIEDRRYRDAVDLGVALATARWQDREVRLEAWGD